MSAESIAKGINIQTHNINNILRKFEELGIIIYTHKYSNKRYLELTDKGKEIQNILRDTQKLLL